MYLIKGADQFNSLITSQLVPWLTRPLVNSSPFWLTRPLVNSSFSQLVTYFILDLNYIYRLYIFKVWYKDSINVSKGLKKTEKNVYYWV